jgi:hypothetical protein
MKKYLLIIGLFFSLPVIGQVKYKIELYDLSYEILANLQHPTTSNVTIEIQYDDNSRQQVYYKLIGFNGDNEVNWGLNPPIITTKRPLNIHTVGFVNFSSGTDADYDNYSAISMCATTDYIIPSGSARMSNIRFKVKSTPVVTINSKALDGSVNTFLPSDDKITINADTGFLPSVYNWQYSSDGISWNDFPATLSSQGQSAVNVSLKDIYGINYYNYIGSNTYFRIRTCSADYSNIITLNNIISAPHINSIAPVSNTCYGSENGGFVIQFDRALISGESLSVAVYNSLNEVFTNITNIVALDADNKLTSPLIFPPDTYRIELIDKYNNNAGYSDAHTHTATTSFTGPTAIDFNTAKRDIYCYNAKDGTITVNASGGNGAYKVLYKKEADVAYKEMTFASATQHTITGLDVGTYKVRILDQNGCYKKDGSGNEVISTIILTQPDEALKIDNKQISHPTEFGATDGKIQAIIIGGTPNGGNYNIQWTNANGTTLSNFTNTSNPFKTMLNNVGDGKYILKITDNNYALAQSENAASCMVIDTFIVKQPKLLSVVIEKYKSISCSGETNGEVYAKAMGGIEIPGQKYKYQWFKELNGAFTALTQTDSILTAVGIGTYKVKITDQNNISKGSASFSLTEPSPLSFSTIKRDVYCYNGKDATITINASGASGNYKLLYKNQDDFNYTTIAFASPGQHQLSNLDIGTYKIRVMDSNGCYQKDATGAEVIQTITILQPAQPLRIDAKNLVNPTAFNLNNGRAEVTISGGTPNAGTYKVQWTDINRNSLSNFSNTVNPFKTVLNNLPDGKYILKVTDGNFALAQTANAVSCLLIDTITLKQPDPLKVVIEELKYVACKGDSNGQLYAKATGGIIIPAQKYKYQWFKEVNGAFNVIAQTDSVLLNVNAGVYKVIITDQNNISKESVTFNLTEPVALAVTVSSTPLVCSGDINGTAKAIITGGTLPYKIEWSNGETTANINNLTDGSYLVFVTDAHGCQVQEQIIIAAPNPLKISTDLAKNPTCFGNNDGAISHNITGGKQPYKFQWSNGATSQNLTNLAAGTYTFVVSESNGCNKTITYNLTDPAAVVVNLGPDVTLCIDQVFEADATVPNGAIYKWTGSNGFTANTAKVSLSLAGVYNVEVITDKGCVGRDAIEIKKSNAVIASEFVVTTQTFKNETVNLVNISNPRPQTVEWLLPNSSNIKVIAKTDDDLQLSFAATGTYTISLKANVGDCSKIFTKLITVVEGTSFNDLGTVKDPFIKSFQIAPNPNNGAFYAKIELQEASKIKLRLLNTITGQLMDTREESGSSSYNLPYNLTLSTGVYVMVLETPKGNMVHKVLIQ